MICPVMVLSQVEGQITGRFCIRLSLRKEPGFCPRHQKSLGNTAVAGLHFWQTSNDVETTKRKPMLLLRLSGLLLLRYAQRALFRLLLNEPPRRTRLHRADPSQRVLRPGSDSFHPASKQAAQLSRHAGSVFILAVRHPSPLLA